MMNGAKLDCDEIQSQILLRLNESLAKCDKLCDKAYDQERYFDTSIVPEIEEKRTKATVAYHKQYQEIKNCKTQDDLLFYMEHSLRDERGLFYNIFRGKLNKHINPLLPEEAQAKTKFKTTF